MTIWVVNGPNGESIVDAGGRWDAINYQRAIDKGLDVIDMSDVAAEIVNLTQPLRKISVMYLSDNAIYSATEVVSHG